MPLKQKFSELTFIGKKFMAYFEGPRQQGWGLRNTHWLLCSLDKQVMAVGLE